MRTSRDILTRLPIVYPRWFYHPAFSSVNQWRKRANGVPRLSSCVFRRMLRACFECPDNAVTTVCQRVRLATASQYVSLAAAYAMLRLCYEMSPGAWLFNTLLRIIGRKYGVSVDIRGDGAAGLWGIPGLLVTFTIPRHLFHSRQACFLHALDKWLHACSKQGPISGSTLTTPGIVTNSLTLSCVWQARTQEQEND